MKEKGRRTRYIDVRPCKEKLFEGPNTHDPMFSLNGMDWHIITLTTNELRRLSRKIKIYLKTLENDEDLR